MKLIKLCLSLFISIFFLCSCNSNNIKTVDSISESNRNLNALKIDTPSLHAKNSILKTFNRFSILIKKGNFENFDEVCDPAFWSYFFSKYPLPSNLSGGDINEKIKKLCSQQWKELKTQVNANGYDFGLELDTIGYGLDLDSVKIYPIRFNLLLTRKGETKKMPSKYLFVTRDSSKNWTFFDADGEETFNFLSSNFSREVATYFK